MIEKLTEKQIAATCVRLPVLQYDHSRSIPVVIVSHTSGHVGPCHIFLHWARAQVRYSLLDPAARAWCNFLNYVVAAHSEFPIQGDDLNHLVGAYLLVRHTGTHGPNWRHLEHLGWKPANYNVLKLELILIESILRLAATQLGYVDLGLTRFHGHQVSRAISELSILASTAPSELSDDFFLHLRAARIHWAQVHGRHDVQLPSVIRRQNPPKGVHSCFSTAEVWEIARHERNPVFRAIWLAGGFGGLRISEQLNAFQIDILPPSARSLLFPGSDDIRDNTILYLRAHPSESRYTGSLSRFSMTRREYLSSRYGLAPRTEMKHVPGLRGLSAGWKGTVPSGDHFLHQVMWCNNDAARAFADCMLEISEMHRRHKTSLRHPWLFVNIGDTDHFGEPLKISRVNKAFAAACSRAGIEPYRFGRNLHGFRHHYVAILSDKLGLDDKHIQIAMGHASIFSQQDYKKKQRAAYEALRDRATA